jgi:phosphoribosylanthranilate isomerase
MAVNRFKPDYIGFVFAESRRKVTPNQAWGLKTALSPGIKTVGVFVNEPLPHILSLLNEGVVDIIQLHGAEDENFILKLKNETDAKIVKAVSVQKKGDAQAWENSAADFLLLDHKGGGTGENFDWDLIGTVAKPFFLAGGLNSENVAQAVKKISPYAVDTSSGAEISPGVKCAEKIKRFIHEGRGAYA